MIHRIFELLKTYNNPRYWAKNVLWRYPSTISHERVIFVLGSPRSGTTLLQRILAVHSRLFSIQGETGLFSCQNIFDPKRNHFGLEKKQRRKLFEDSSDIVDFFDKGIQYLSRQNNGKQFIEKTPQHVLHIPFILKHFPESRLIHIVRDGRDCYCSSKSHRSIPQNTSVSRFAKYWKKCVSAPIAYETDARLFTIKYEELSHDPGTTIQNVMNFLGLAFEAGQLDPELIQSDSRAKLNEFKRLSEPINSSSVNRYVSELTPQEIQIFARIAGKELIHYHYPINAKATEESTVNSNHK
jgi:hypothetical protein